MPDANVFSRGRIGIGAVGEAAVAVVVAAARVTDLAAGDVFDAVINVARSREAVPEEDDLRKRRRYLLREHGPRAESKRRDDNSRGCDQISNGGEHGGNSGRKIPAQTRVANRPFFTLARCRNRPAFTNRAGS